VENVEEQQAAEPKPHVDPVLVLQVITLTRDVNDNLSGVLRNTGRVIVRQNILTVLFLVAMILQTMQLFLGYSMQRLQQSSKVQLASVEQARVDLQRELTEVSKSLREVKVDVKDVGTQLNSVPTVTSDKAGRLSLEVPLDSTKAATTDAAKIVIPLKPAQSRLER